MKKLIIAIGILTMLAASTPLSWAESKPMYVCYLEKTKQTRYVDKASDCHTSEMAMALSPVAQTGATDSRDQQSSAKELEQDPTMPFSQILSSDGGGSSSSP